jgi:hypothetical protein
MQWHEGDKKNLAGTPVALDTGTDEPQFEGTDEGA